LTGALITGVLVLEDVDRPSAAHDIDAVALTVDEQIIGIAAGLEVGKHCVARHCRHQETRRAAKNHEHALPLMIECHWEIRAMAVGGNVSGRLALG